MADESKTAQAAEAAAPSPTEGARMAKRKKEIARELATVRPELVLRVPEDGYWVFMPVMPGEAIAEVIYLNPRTGARDPYTLGLPDYRAFAEKMMATLKAAA